MSRPNVLRCAIAVVGLAVAAAALGAEPPDTPTSLAQPNVAPTAGATKGLTCRTRQRPGSRIVTRTCLTAAQWTASAMLHGASFRDGTGGAGPWGAGAVSTAGASVGMSAFTAR